MSNQRLPGKKAVITGGTTGIGFETARRFLEEGAEVLITGRSDDKVASAVAELGEGAHGIAADASTFEGVKKLAVKAKATFGMVDILFANAGNGVFIAIDDVSEESFDHQFDLNVKGVFFTVQQFLPLLGKGASIVLNASSVQAKGMATGSLYFATKAAVRSFARSFAAELAPAGIRVNSVSPGLVPTQFFANSNVGAESYGGFEALIGSSAPLARPGTPLEIANAVLFLASDEASYMTATDVVVDGGWSNV
ncbi:SDR family oxidoreductase [Kordiimonas aestuarii]|uniref:SDR family oxidoreductase n=1 Tax=Kordiimonas aestuarii TaxID=1005925 RepID=UPI0021CE2528|nr:SDR family oxidoreductase [Kordiimonas aestuarii]